MRHFVDGVEEIAGAVEYVPTSGGQVSIGCRLNCVDRFRARSGASDSAIARSNRATSISRADETDPAPALVHRRPAVPVDGHQLHRPADAERARADPEGPSTSGRTPTSRGSSSRSASPMRSGRRSAAGSSTGVGTRRGLSLAVASATRSSAMLTSLADGLPELLRVPLPARPGRSGQLARRDEGRLRVVPAARERLGGGALRQRIVDRRARSRRSSCSALPARSAAGGRRSSITGRARVPLDAAVPMALPHARGASAAVAGGASRHPGESRADASAQPTRRARSCSYRVLLPLPQTWGIVIGKALHRSGLVLHHRLVRDLPRGARIHARGEPGRRSGCPSSPPTSATSSAAACRAR